MTDTQNDAIINPVKGKKAPNLGPVAVMVSSETDLRFISGLMNLEGNNFTNLAMSKLYTGDDDLGNFSAVGPLVGAPYAAILLEPLIAWGAQKIIFFGWCGAISHDIKIGDIIIPSGAVIDEGTSKHYNADESEIAKPSPHIVEKTKDALRKRDITFREGVIWSTDAIYRETREKVEDFQTKNVLAVDMELSALFTVGKFRNVEVGAVLVVSDELSTFKWNPGFKNERFKQSRVAVTEVIHSLCQAI
ncbi:nucleoside phosphorylase [Desulfonema magnum]|uniref:Uridine phosphorylase n=1 Tax=Desulfonema magnum TaxID=45655 RepID=A0A975BQY8_9BACT|nr:nucleoside phosphorylase [Desulfonema magnum]QTA89455.1 Putative purine nucleoside phosphorylase [Desulfonema magnum]